MRGLRGVPGVRRYLLVLWGPLLMLLNIFDYLSDGRAPLVDGLRATFYLKNHDILRKMKIIFFTSSIFSVINFLQKVPQAL